MKSDTILLHAHPKTGQHWFLFTLMNYTMLLKKDRENTVPFASLNAFEFKMPYHELVGNVTVQDVSFEEGIPKLKRSEAFWSQFLSLHESFDKVLYLCRNPFDTMLSFLHWFEKDVEDLFSFVKERLPRYITHLKEGIPQADVVIWYEDARKDPHVHEKGLSLCYEEIDEEVVKKALKLSSFKSINEINPHHARDGRVRQFESVMSPECVNYIKEECEREGVWKWIEEVME